MLRKNTTTFHTWLGPLTGGGGGGFFFLWSVDCADLDSLGKFNPFKLAGNLLHNTEVESKECLGLGSHDRVIFCILDL